MEPDKEKVIKSFKRWTTQEAREQQCNDEDIMYIIYDYIVDAVPSGRY